MKKGTKVSFSWFTDGEAREERHGTGEVITDEEDGKVLVSVDPDPPEARHFVIRCNVTWLTKEITS